jgi:hypothetical protein
MIIGLLSSLFFALTHIGVDIYEDERTFTWSRAPVFI